MNLTTGTSTGSGALAKIFQGDVTGDALAGLQFLDAYLPHLLQLPRSA
jgi:hypothetical protein